jgi:hypothetical protein
MIEYDTLAGVEKYQPALLFQNSMANSEQQSSPGPSKGRQWRGGFAMNRPRLSARAITVIASLAVVLAFSTWVQFRLVGAAGGEAVVIDTARYVEIAAGFQQAKLDLAPLEGDLIRTPGFPILLFAVAEAADVSLAETALPPREWRDTNTPGRLLITRVLEVQCAIAVLIPVLIYLMVLGASRSIVLALLAAFAYFTDPATLSFQFVLATESLSILMLFSSLAMFALLLRTGTPLAAFLLGLSLTAALLVKPTLAVLALILVGAALIQLIRGSGLRNALPAAALLLTGTLLEPLAWASFNAVTLGHFVFSRNAAWALQNFSAKRFVNLEVEDDQLEVLQWHAQRTFETPRERAWSPRGQFVFTRSYQPVAEELEIDDEYDFILLMERANRMAIRAHPVDFLQSGLDGALKVWTAPYQHPKNKEALRRVRKEPLLGRLARMDGYLLLGKWTGAALVALGLLALLISREEERIFLGAAGSFLVAYTLLTSFFDEAELHRHAMQSRVLANVLLLWCVWVLLRAIARKTGVLAGRSG